MARGLGHDPAHSREYLSEIDHDRFRSIVEHLPAIAFEDLVGPGDDVRSAYVGPQLSSVLGYDPQDWVESELWATSLHPDDREETIRAFEEAIARGEGSYVSEYRIIRPDERVVWIREEGNLTRDAQGVLHVLGVMLDITEQKRIHVQLSEAETKFQALVEQIPAVLYIDRPHDHYEMEYVSPQIRQILGIEPEEWINVDDAWIKHLHPEDRGWVLEQYQDYLAGGPDIDDYRMVRPDGSIVWIRDRARTIRDEQGNSVQEQGLMIDVTELKEAERLVRQQVAALEKIDAIGRELTDLVLKGSDLKRLLQGLAEVLGKPVILEDAAHQLVEFAVYILPLDEVLEAWESHSREGHEEEERSGARRQEGEPACVWIPITLHDEQWGRIHVLEVDAPIEESEHLALDRAAAAIGLSLLSERNATSLADHAGSALVADILHGRSASESEILHRAKGLGADLKGWILAALVVEPQNMAAFLADLGLSERDRQRIVAGILRESRIAIGAADCVGLAASEGARAVVIVGLPPEAETRSVLEDLGMDICQRVSAAFDGLTVAVGASGEAQLSSLRNAVGEASEAASYGARMSGPTSVRHFRDLGVQHLLSILSEGPELARFVESELSPLLRRDAKSSSPLLETLRVVLEHSGRKQPAARALHIERRTLYHRIDRIEHLLNRDLEDHETRVQLGVALRGLDLLRERRPG